MRIDDVVNVVLIDIGVPDTFRLDDQHRTFFAAIQTAGLINTYFTVAIHVQCFEAFLCVFLNAGRAAIMTARPSVLTLVEADEHMILVVGFVSHEMAVMRGRGESSQRQASYTDGPQAKRHGGQREGLCDGCCA